MELGVNIDHIATVRQARKTFEPDPILGAFLAELGGADAITVHLREDRRHISDRDVRLLRETITTKLNLEMSCAEEIVRIAIDFLPQQATLVPEKREEITTEGGLDVLANKNRVADVVARLKEKGIFVSLFMGTDVKQLMAAIEAKPDAIELHTGFYANSQTDSQRAEELNRLKAAAAFVTDAGLRLHAGHGLNYQNVKAIVEIPKMHELNIGHSIISRALFVGVRDAVAEMKKLIPKSVWTAALPAPYAPVVAGFPFQPSGIS